MGKEGVSIKDYRGTSIEKGFQKAQGRQDDESLGECIDRLMDEGLDEDEAREICEEGE